MPASPQFPLHVPGLLPLGQLTSTTSPAGAPAAPAPAAPAPAAPHPAPAVEAPAGGNAQAPVAGNNTTQKSEVPTTGPKENPGLLNQLGGILPIILMLVVLYLFMFRGQKKEEKRRKTLLAEMKKGDKVQTIGGLVASVVSIDNDEVVLKVDESANVKAVYKKSAILNVIVPAGDKKSK